MTSEASETQMLFGGGRSSVEAGHLPDERDRVGTVLTAICRTGGDSLERNE